MTFHKLENNDDVFVWMQLAKMMPYFASPANVCKRTLFVKKNANHTSKIAT